MASGDERRGSGTGIARDLIELLVVAVIAVAGLAGAVAAREAHAPEWAEVAEYTSAGEVLDRAGAARVGDTAAMDVISLLVEGTRSSAAAAVRALVDNDPTAAAVASDAAMRAAEVGRSGTAGAVHARFGLVLQDIRDARRARQNGRFLRAVTVLTRVAAELGAMPIHQPDRVVPQDSALDGYEGARLLNAAGELIGAVGGVSRGAAGAPRITLVIGGHHHVLGLFDIGGTKISVPADRLVFGQRRHVGPTFVVLATLERAPQLTGAR